MAVTRSFRPSNGTAGMIFDDAWCSRCQRDDAFRQDENNDGGCDILTRTFAHNIDDPEYPVEWIEDDVEWPTPTNPRCSAFIEIGKKDSTDNPDPRQIEMPI